MTLEQLDQGFEIYEMEIHAHRYNLKDSINISRLKSRFPKVSAPPAFPAQSAIALGRPAAGVQEQHMPVSSTCMARVAGLLL